MGVVQLARTPDCGSGGRRFESDHPPQTLIAYKYLRKTKHDLQCFTLCIIHESALLWTVSLVGRAGDS